MKSTLSTIALITTCLLPNISNANDTQIVNQPENSYNNPDPVGFFHEVDVDKSGGLSPKEVTANPNLSSRFDSYDINGNGEIDYQEFLHAVDKRATRMEKFRGTGSMTAYNFI